MNAITIQQYLHRPNATELGQGNTNECYMLISTEIDISDIFPIGVEISTQDTWSGKVYKLKAAKIREYRINQFGDLYRDYDVRPGDEILITKISGEDIEKVYVTVNKFNRVFINVTGNGAELFNIDRMQSFKTSNEKYSLPVSYSGVNGNLVVTYDGQKKKRQDSPVLTDFYSAVFNGQRLQNRLYFLDIATHNELLILTKSEYNKVIVDSAFNIDKFLGKCNARTKCIQYQSISDILIVKRNLILTGAPGTGKTFTAKAMAATIISDGKSDWNGLTEEQKKQVAFVQFHPSYDYTDFVEGLRPVTGGEFRRQDGVFKAFCKRAVADSGESGDVKSPKPYIFIIDEINRGELSKIFGELFYAIEPDYRGKAGTVQTQYNNLVENEDVFKFGFYIPENVYIIGTMNDVDRGVEAMDFAIRRRFAWIEVTAEESADNMGITGLSLEKMKALNAALIANGLSRAYSIGGAYFRKLENDDYDSLWKYHLEGIVYEYFRGEPDAEEKLQAVKRAFEETNLPASEQASETQGEVVSAE